MGLLSANITLDVKDFASSGIIVLQPSGSDTSVATINRTQAGTTRVKARQKVGYVTVDALNTLKLGSADLNIGADGFLAFLVRIKVPESLKTSFAKIATTSQTIASGADAGQPKLTIGVGGRQNNSPSSLVRGRFFAWSEKNDGSRGFAADSASTYKTYNVTNPQTYWGDNSRPGIWNQQAEWAWLFVHRSTAQKNSATNFLAQTSISFIEANSMACGIYPMREDTQMKAMAGMSARGDSLNVTATSNNGIQAWTGLDFVLGGSTSMDIARIIKVSSSINAQQAGGLFTGKTFEDIGLTPTSDDFIINLSSSAEAGAKITTAAGAPTWNSTATDGPFLEFDAGTVTTTLAKTIATGKVIL